MKRNILLIVVFVSTMMAQAQDKYFESCPLTVIEEGWKTKPIDNVINGSLGIVLERFNSTWPTWMGSAICETMEQGLDKRVIDEETSLIVTVDVDNGYADVTDGGTDGAYMAACVWNRSNGHRLLAVRMGKPTDPFIEFVCFYDFDPAKKMLTPEPEILKGYRWNDRAPYTQMFYKLPKIGKDMVVEEWGNGDPLKHIFAWDGMKPVYTRTEPLVYDDGLDDITVSYQGKAPNVKDFMTAILSENELGEAWGSLKQNWDLYRNGMHLMPGCDIIVDTQNGYVGFEESEMGENRMVMECCYWNYADRKHKLVAVSNDYYQNGQAIAGQYTGVTFYKYDNTTRKMKLASAMDLGLEFDAPPGTHATTHSLPRRGKTIVYTFHVPAGKIEKRMTWNGNEFVAGSK
jgi:hypothetical protein